MAEGVGNPVYDSFNEGQPLEEVSDATDQRSVTKQITSFYLSVGTYLGH